MLKIGQQVVIPGCSHCGETDHVATIVSIVDRDVTCRVPQAYIDQWVAGNEEWEGDDTAVFSQEFLEEANPD